MSLNRRFRKRDNARPVIIPVSTTAEEIVEREEYEKCAKLKSLMDQLNQETES